MATDGITTIQAIDDDLTIACDKRHDAWRRLVVKDTAYNRSSYNEACAEVDSLLEMRHGLTAEAKVEA